MSSGIALCGMADAQAQQANDKRPIVTGASMLFGVYDPHGDFNDDTGPSIEHIFLPWEDVDLGTLTTADNYAIAHRRSLLVTVEPWSWLAREQHTPTELYDLIMQGRLDQNMGDICARTAVLRSPVTIRWGQEMEVDHGQFIWSSWSPQQFISAFQHVVTVCRRYDRAARYMWSPLGEANLAIYYPGDDYVDMVGVTLFGLQQRDQNEVGRDRSFEDMLAPLYERVAGFNKPVYVAEFGYDGDAAYVRDWARTVTRPMFAFPLLRGVIYFDDREVYPWPDGYGLPDWRVTASPTPLKK
ncbi:MAG: hypothetical protein LBF16_05635 [Pseudomonadales bacterium]|nr:hypothetical protein [Pseudomonadales bacterium]